MKEETVHSKKFPPFFLAFTATPSPYPRTSQDTHCFDYASLLKWVKSSDCVYLLGCGLSNLIPNSILFGPQTPHNKVHIIFRK